MILWQRCNLAQLSVTLPNLGFPLSEIISGAHQALGEACEAVLPLREDHC